MPSDRNDSFYDLTSASRISARLRSETASARPSEVQAAPEYVRFSISRLHLGEPPGAGRSPTRATSDLAVLEEPLPWSGEMMGSVGWAKMLEWCVGALDADAAFIVDGRGLLIGESGILSPEEIEETGARLIVAFEQADQMSRSHGRALSLSIELDSGWLVGIRVPLQDQERLIVGVLSARALSQGARQEIATAFTKKALGV